MDVLGVDVEVESRGERPGRRCGGGKWRWTSWTSMWRWKVEVNVLDVDVEVESRGGRPGRPNTESVQSLWT